MAGYSWNSRKQQGVFFCQCSAVPSRNSRARSPLFGSDCSENKAVYSRQILVIGKAYDEPICNVHVENLLLQRDYIID